MRRLSVAILVALAVACIPKPPPAPPGPPPVDPTWPQQCRDIFHQELGLEVGQYPDAWIPECVGWFQSGLSGAEVRALARTKVPPAPPPLPRVDVSARPTAGGEPWVWRGETSFRLAHMVATGDREGARRAMHAAADRGFNVVRVLTTAVWLFDLAPAAGRAALPDLLEEAERFRLYVSVVAVADSADRDYDFRAHARAVAEVCATFDNCLYEFANEPYHGTQHADIHDPADAEREAAAAVAGLPALAARWTVGPSQDDEALEPRGAFLTRHLNRSRDMLNQARHYKDVLELADVVDRYVVGNEPTGADERHPDAEPGDCARTVSGGQRFWCPAFFAFLGFAQAGWGGGGTFHTQAGLRSEPFGPDQERGARAFLEAMALIPDVEQGTWTFRNAGAGGSPILNPGGSAAFEDRGEQGGPPGPIIRAYSFLSGDRGYAGILHRPLAYPDGVLEWGNGWRPAEAVVAYPQFIIFRLERP